MVERETWIDTHKVSLVYRNHVDFFPRRFHSIQFDVTCVVLIDEVDVFVDVFLRSRAGSSSTKMVFCEPIALLCDIGGVCSASRCPYVWYLSALLLIEPYLLLSYTGEGDGFDETD